MLDRRALMLQLGSLGLGGLTLPHLLEAATPRKKQAKACILVFLWGGPPQQDMWDMKPEAPVGIRSLFKPIKTKVPGIDICDQMPMLAKHTDKCALVRSVTHNSNEHEPSVYHMMTGKINPSLRVPRNIRNRGDFPNIPAIVSHFSKPGPLPSSVTIPAPIGHDGVTYTGTYAGWLGPKCDPLELKGVPRAGDPPFALTPRPELGPSRLSARKTLLQHLDATEKGLQNNPATKSLTTFHEKALQMVASPAAKRALDLEKEPAPVRDRYGKNQYGDCFLLARRLVEAGVRLVTFNWIYQNASGQIFNVWDNHGGTGGLGGITGYAMLKAPYCLPPLDRGLSTLLEDLKERGMLDETLVVVLGEFGRTPKINGSSGRDHWGACQTVLFAGGGVKGGQVYGATDAQAAYVKDMPVSPSDVLATMYQAMGIAPDAEIHDRERRPVRICDGKPVRKLLT